MTTKAGYLDKYSINSSFVNPASLAFLEKKLSFSIFNNKFYYHFDSEFESPQKTLLSIYQPFEYEGGIQLFLKNFDSKIGYSENHLGISYSHKLNNFAFGITTNYYFQNMEIFNELENKNIEFNESTLFFDLGIIWRIYHNIYLSSSVKALNSSEHINYDNSLTLHNRYGNFYINNFTYKNGIDEFENQIGIGCRKSFLNGRLIPSVGINFGNSIIASMQDF